ncbi:MAG: DUF4062 domain-containing protein [Magnetococcales bacterium]|nr:DUF4062 domain-containing protein [Magnetococcales bacterium]
MSRSKTFRLFLSSTFNDLRAERDKLQVEVFPKLRKYCEDRGFSFQPIDLRWGVSSEAGNDQKTMQICIDEVKRCKNALNPHFAIMLGERYGWIPLPAEVEAEEFDLVKKAVLAKYPGDSKEKSYIELWYKKDENAIPAEYKLQPRIELEHQNWDYWGDVESTLREAFSSIVNKELKDKLSDEQKFKYTKSATEQEIIEGLFNNENIAKENIFFYKRNFENIDSLSEGEIAILEEKDRAYRKEVENYNATNPDKKKAAYEITVKHFSDFKNKENKLDDKIRPCHHELTNKIISDLPEQNVKIYNIKLDVGLARTQDSVTEGYLQKFSDDFYKNILASIKKEIDAYQEVDIQTRELNEQQNFLIEKAKIFVGREKLLQQIDDYIGSEESNAPLIIYADSGSGKSALMAKVVKNTIESSLNDGTTIAYRFVGISELSNSPINLHNSLCAELVTNEALRELCVTYIDENELKPDHVLIDLKELSKMLAYLIENFPEDQKLILFIDALDQFVINDPLDWLPRILPSNAKIIISTLPDTYQGIKYLPRLKQRYANREESFLFLEKFAADEASHMIDEYLKSFKRTLNKTQKQKVLKAFSQSGSPLYLKILLEEVSEWKSYTSVGSETYPKELDDLIARLFERLHTNSYHSHPLIKFAFAYIACSKGGLPEPELFDILSQNKAIMDDVSNEFYPRPERLPTAVWARLFSQVSQYLTVKKVDGLDKISFFHRKFNEGAYKLLENREVAHANLVNFYEAVYNKTLNVDTSEESALTELPYQLIMSKQNEKSLTLLTDFEFLMKKFKLNKTGDVLENYALAKAMGINQETTQNNLNEKFYIYDNFLISNKHLLEQGDNDWDSSKIFFQLSIEHANNSQLTIDAEEYEKQGKIAFNYLRNINRDEGIYISPLKDILKSHNDRVEGLVKLKNGGFLSYSRDEKIIIWSDDAHEMAVLNGHEGSIDGVIELGSGYLLSWSEQDETVRMWNLDGEGVYKLDKIKVVGVIEKNNDNILIKSLGSSEDRRFHLLHLLDPYENTLKTFKKHNDEIGGVLELRNGDNLSWSEDGPLRIWDNNLKEKVVFSEHKTGVRGAIGLSNNNIVSFSEKQLLIWNLDKEIVAKIKFDNSITLVKQLKNTSIVVCLVNLIKVLNQDGDLIASFFEHKDLVENVVELGDDRLLSYSRDKTIRIWNLNGEELACLKGHHDGIAGVLLLHNGDIASYSYDNTIRIWGQDGSELAVLEAHENYIDYLIELESNVLVSSGRDSEIKVWNIANLKYAKSDKKRIPIEKEGIIVQGNEIFSIHEGSFYRWNQHNSDSNAFLGHKKSVVGVVKTTFDTVISYAEDYTLREWDFNGVQLSILDGLYENVKGVLEYSPNKMIAWSDHNAFIWDAKQNISTNFFGLEGGELKKAIALKNGNIVCIFDRSKYVYCYTRNGEIQFVAKGHNHRLRDVIELSNGNLISSSSDNTLRLWNKDGDELAVFEGHEHVVFGAIELSDETILSWSYDKTLRTWNSEGRELAVFEGHGDGINGALELRNKSILSWAGDNTLILWNNEGDQILKFEGHDAAITGALELRDGNILSWSQDSTLRLWNLEGRELAVFKGHEGSVAAAIETDDGILSCSKTSVGTLILWDKSGNVLKIYDEHNNFVQGINKINELIISYDSSGVMIVRDNHGVQQKKLEENGEAVKSILELENGKLLYFSSYGLRELDIEKMTSKKIIGDHVAGIEGLIKLANGNVLSYSVDATLKLWDIHGKEISEMKGHTFQILGAIELSNGNILSYSFDNSLKIWTTEGDELVTLEGHNQAVRGAAELDGNVILSWSDDKTIRLWTFNGEEIACFDKDDTDSWKKHPEYYEKAKWYHIGYGSHVAISYDGHAVYVNNNCLILNMENNLKWYSKYTPEILAKINNFIAIFDGNKIKFLEVVKHKIKLRDLRGLWIFG